MLGRETTRIRDQIALQDRYLLKEKIFSVTEIENMLIYIYI